MGVWIIAGVVLILALLVRWRHALRGWLLSAAGEAETLDARAARDSTFTMQTAQRHL